MTGEMSGKPDTPQKNKRIETTKSNLRPPWTSRPPTSGRKKGKLSIINEIRRLLEENNREGARELAESLLKNFKKGNPVAVTQVMNRVDGVVKEEHEVKAALKIELIAYSPAGPAPEGKK